MFKNEVDKPQVAPAGKQPMNDHSMNDFKKEASDQAYGQGGKSGCMKDHGKIMSQYFSGAYKNDGV
jgi:hypothetical protein